MGLALVVGYVALVVLSLILYECRERRRELTGEASAASPIGAGHQRRRFNRPVASPSRRATAVGAPRALVASATMARKVGARRLVVLAAIGLLTGAVIVIPTDGAQNSNKLEHVHPVKLEHVQPVKLEHVQPPATTAAPSDASALARADIPPRFLALYLVAGRRYGLDWSVLAAVGKLESDHGRSRLPGVNGGTNPVGAAGPMQFLPATWRRYGASVAARGEVDVYDPADAVAAMAGYLRASGAPVDWPSALYAYDHSARYVREVLALAGRYKRR